MNKFRLAFSLSFCSWLIGCLLLFMAIKFIAPSFEENELILLFMIAVISIIASIPVLIGYLIIFKLSDQAIVRHEQITRRIFNFNLVLSALYSCIPLAFMRKDAYVFNEYLIDIMTTGFAILLASSWSSLFFHRRPIHQYYSSEKTHQQMEQATKPTSNQHQIMYKGLLTAGLMLLLLIPMIVVNNLITERKQRRSQIVDEVSNQWAKSQTIAGPYLYIPYKVTNTNAKGKIITERKHFLLLPETVEVIGRISTEIRKRSIYSVPLYRTAMETKGNFKLQLPEGIALQQIIWQEARVCLGITDYKGIEQQIIMRIGEQKLELLPGLPTDQVSENGLAALYQLQAAKLNQIIPFSYNLRIKGSDRLMFLPLAGNSSFHVSSAWPNPSFSGQVLPTNRKVSSDGFNASWQFNKANLPFPTIITEAVQLSAISSFGINMLEPVDHYAKTDRATKYAILLIGLCFALFFMLEIMQKKPLHPIQYVMIGFALVIFYTLLLSIGEFIIFNWAYWIAATATTLLISIYVNIHFRSLKTTAYFTCMLGGVYGFVFVLLQLEDTALLVGSIGLFLILAVIMILSKKMDWQSTITHIEQ